MSRASSVVSIADAIDRPVVEQARPSARAAPIQERCCGRRVGEGGGGERGQRTDLRRLRGEAPDRRAAADSARVDPDDVEPVENGLGHDLRYLGGQVPGRVAGSPGVDEDGAQAVTGVLRLDPQQRHLDLRAVRIVVVQREFRGGALGDLPARCPVQDGRGHPVHQASPASAAARAVTVRQGGRVCWPGGRRPVRARDEAAVRRGGPGPGTVRVARARGACCCCHADHRSAAAPPGHRSTPDT